MHHDFMFVDADEDNYKLPYKTVAFFKAAFNLFDADFYVKADDDIYLRPDRLATLLAKDRAHRLTYIGCMKKGPVITDRNMKWYESSGHLIGNEYFLHAHGPIYALSADIVAALASARNDSLRMFNNEDVTIGSWMLAMNVNHEDTKALCEPICTSTSIAVWSNPRCLGMYSCQNLLCGICIFAINYWFSKPWMHLNYNVKLWWQILSLPYVWLHPQLEASFFLVSDHKVDYM
ncbi:hypothetical protein BHE74_00012524 [Ensete ventricosum]|uniref:Hexosyltransferase n=1 Tax=Ensete ventricosum TaxID=4639 RepID=A0A426ZV63_ENSVE|nr:hypothetical protein B296_00011758 [Ensete ventricosum]RWW79196.1 hypothetical protein BHE74_00012524 [Ensete ventricosum]